MECVYKSKDGVCLKLSTDTFTDYCVEGPCPHEVLSNGDKIRAMTDEELAEWIHDGISSDACDYCEYNNGYCDGGPCCGRAEAEIITDWLKCPKEGE